MLKAARGNLNPAHVVRCARMSGAFGQHIDAVFTSSGLGDLSTRCRRRRTRVNCDHVRNFVEELNSMTTAYLITCQDDCTTHSRIICTREQFLFRLSLVDTLTSSHVAWTGIVVCCPFETAKYSKLTYFL